MTRDSTAIAGALQRECQVTRRGYGIAKGPRGAIAPFSASGIFVVANPENPGAHCTGGIPGAVLRWQASSKRVP